MTERLYYEDAYLWKFTAKVIACRPGKDNNTWEIKLNRSAFYPTSGGQPFDTGTLRWEKGETTILNVESDQTGDVLHTSDREIPVGTEVYGEVDGIRRTDHMEQHGGEHMLAGAIWEKIGGTTIGLHLGKENSSIDVSVPDGRTHLTEDEIFLLEDTVNTRIRNDVPIRCWFPDPDELKSLPLRKPPTVDKHVRIVAMGDFEMVACGGTHPSSTGRIGHLKIISAVPAKGKIRITFVCGGRADKLFQKYMRCADKVSHVLSCPTDRLASSAGELVKRLADSEKKINRFETDRILTEIYRNETEGDLNGITLSATIMNAGDAKPTAEAVSAYIAEPGKLLLLWVEGRLTFARSPDVEIDMSELIRRVGKGGGRPDLAGGAGIQECISVARKILITEGKDKVWRKKI